MLNRFVLQFPDELCNLIFLLVSKNPFRYPSDISDVTSKFFFISNLNKTLILNAQMVGTTTHMVKMLASVISSIHRCSLQKFSTLCFLTVFLHQSKIQPNMHSTHTFGASSSISQKIWEETKGRN